MAQPGATPPARPVPAPPQPQPAVQGYPPADVGPPLPYVYQPAPVLLTPEEQELLAEGEMPIVQHAGGGALAFFVGFGLGQAVQGRWSDTGWMFTLGDAAAYTAIIAGAREFEPCVFSDSGSCNNTRAGLLIVGGAISLLGLHIWQTVDAFVVPGNRNQRVRALRQRLGLPAQQPYSSFVAPSRDGTGSVGGLTLRF